MDDIPIPLPVQSIRFMDQLRASMRARHLAYRTEKTYCEWIKDFIRFHKKRHPETMGTTEVDAWLSYLANERSVAITQRSINKATLMELFEGERIGSDMKRDGRTLDRATQETIRLMAIERVREGESPAEVIASFGFNRTTI